MLKSSFHSESWSVVTIDDAPLFSTHDNSEYETPSYSIPMSSSGSGIYASQVKTFSKEPSFYLVSFLLSFVKGKE